LQVLHDDAQREYAYGPAQGLVCAENLIRVGGVRESALLAA
jgi:hypothetical protein